MWIRSRAKWSHGFSDWDYEYTGKSSFEDCVEIKKESSDNEWGWSEHYRGIEIEKVENPPEDVIKAEIEYTKGHIKRYETRLKELMKYTSETS